MRKMIMLAAMLAMMLVAAAPAMAQGEGSANAAAIADAGSSDMEDVSMGEIEKAQAISDLVATQAEIELFESDARDSKAETIKFLTEADFFKQSEETLESEEIFLQQDSMRIALENMQTMQDMGLIGGSGGGLPSLGAGFGGGLLSFGTGLAIG